MLFCCARLSLLWMGFSLVVGNGGYSVAAVHRILIMVPSPWSIGCRETRLKLLQYMGSTVETSRLQNTGSIAVAQGLSFSEACGFILDQGSNWCLLYWQVDFLPLSHHRSPTQLHLFPIFSAIHFSRISVLNNPFYTLSHGCLMWHFCKQSVLFLFYGKTWYN